MASRPTQTDVDTTLEVLLYLHEYLWPGADRDEISHVRHLVQEHFGDE